MNPVKDIAEFEAEGHPDPVLAWKRAVQAAICEQAGGDLRAVVELVKHRRAQGAATTLDSLRNWKTR